MRAPSGLQAGSLIAPTPGILSRRTMSPEATSTMLISSSPFAKTTKANWRPSGDQLPVDEMKLMASKCASPVTVVSRRTISPVRASAMKIA